MGMLIGASEEYMSMIREVSARKSEDAESAAHDHAIAARVYGEVVKAIEEGRVNDIPERLTLAGGNP